MLSKEYYLAKAEQYSQMAAAAGTDELASKLLRVFAANYLELANTAEKPAEQNQGKSLGHVAQASDQRSG